MLTRLKSIKVSWLDSELNLCEKTFRSELLSRDTLAFSCSQEWNETLARSIEANGMKFPLIAIPNSVENHKAATYDLSNACAYVPLATHLIVYGNQRLAILDGQEKTEDIPVILARDHWEAILIHNTMQAL